MTDQPETLGKFKIISILGEGSMGMVYKAIDPDIQEYVALKTIHQDLLSGENSTMILQRFINEVKAGRLLKHPNIVAIYSYQEDPESGTHFIAMEFVEGKTLRTEIQERTDLGVNEICNIMEQLLAGLGQAHQQGVVHRDIKPDNIILKDNQDVRIADFGIARLETSSMTMDGSILGSPSYMSPEQCIGNPADGRSDLFSAAIVFYEMLTGQKPFSGSVFMETMQQITNKEPSPPSTLNQALDKRWDALLSRALAKHVDDRYQSADAFLAAIRNIHQATPSKQTRFTSKPKTLSLAIAACIILGAGGLWLWRSNEPASDLTVPEKPVLAPETPVITEPKQLSLDDQLQESLTKYACDTLTHTIDDQAIKISGPVSVSNKPSLITALQAMATPQQVEFDLFTLLDETCQTLTLLKPYSIQNAISKAGLQIEPSQHDWIFVEGESPVFEVLTPNYDSYLYVDYLMADGSVFHLLPLQEASNRSYSARQQVMIGEEGTTRRWQISAPYGYEILSIIASSEPLFGARDNDLETTETYYQRLKSALENQSTATIVTDSFIINTKSQAEAEQDFNDQ